MTELQIKMSNLPVGAGEQPQQTVKKDALTILDAAQRCLDGFQSCLDMAGLIHSREVSLVEDQLARFSIWAANIKALGKARDSLDHRLRESPDVQDIITGLLEALGAHLHHCEYSPTWSAYPSSATPTRHSQADARN